MKTVNVGTNKSYNLTLRFTSTTEYSVFEHSEISLESNSSHEISPVWEDLQDQPVTIYVDLGNDGTIDDSLIVDNQYTSVNETQTTIPQQFSLSQNYPNPFNSSTNIRFALPTETSVKLEIFNLLGERIVTLVDETRQAGYYTEQFDASGLSSGVYLYRLQAGDPSVGSGQSFVETKKLLLLK